jgi:chorismate-pyruvate lyase
MTTIAPATYDTNLLLAEPIQRLLLTTDGTLTDLLEALNREKLCVVVLKQEIAPVETGISALALTAGEPLLKREVVLKGKASGAV